MAHASEIEKQQVGAKRPLADALVRLIHNHHCQHPCPADLDLDPDLILILPYPDSENDAYPDFNSLLEPPPDWPYSTANSPLPPPFNHPQCTKKNIPLGENR